MPIQLVALLKSFRFNVKTYLLLLLANLLVVHSVQAQVFGNRTNSSILTSEQKIVSDSTKKKQLKTNDQVVIHYRTASDTSQIAPDSSIHFLHRNPLISVWDQDLGNTGSAYNSIYFNPSMQAGMEFGSKVFNAYLVTWDSTKFINTTRPYTDLYYRLGTKQEQMIEFMHSQNVKPLWNITAKYSKIGSPGFYKFQRTNQDHASLSTNYQSPNLRYALLGAVLYNKIQQDENGGILNERYLSDIRYNDKRLVPVVIDGISTTRSSISNNFRSFHLHLDHHYDFGQTDTIINADSTEKSLSFKPVFGIRHQFYADFAYYRYKDLTPDSLFYTNIAEVSPLLGDSLQVKYFRRLIGNMISLQGNVYVKDNVFRAEAGYGLEIESPNNGPYQRSFYNNFLFGKISKPLSHDSIWVYSAEARLYMTGNTKGNFNFSALAGRYILNHSGILQVGLMQSLQTAPYLYSGFNSNYFQLNKDFSKQSFTKIYAQFLWPSKYTSIECRYLMVGNYLYRDTSLQNKQYSKIIPIAQVLLNKGLHWRKWILDNQLALQVVSNQSSIHLPLFASRHRLAYEDKLFKQKLQVSTGLEFRWNSTYYADNYSPIWNSFVTQYQRQIANYPQFAAFFNFKVKRFRASVAVDQIQQLFIANHLNYAFYGAQNFGFRFGFHWVMIN